MSGSGILRRAVIVAGAFLAFAVCGYSQTPDSVLINGVRPDSIRVAGSVPAPDSLRMAVGSEQPSRREQRKLRRIEKEQGPELPSRQVDPFRVVGGRRIDLVTRDTTGVSDSLAIAGLHPDPLMRDSLEAGLFAGEEVVQDSTLTIIGTEQGDSTLMFTGTVERIDTAGMSRRARRVYDKEQARADSTLYRHSPYFRDTLSFAKTTLLSVVVPGFSQFYNGDYWKIPVLYGVAGSALYFGIKENGKYREQKEIYDYRFSRGFPREFIDPVQTNMMRHNTAQQLLFGTAVASYIYFLGDGAVNYPSEQTRIKTATTLSIICPGAGQVYNGSYWRVPIVAGGFAGLIYMVDWNNRRYQRYKTAFQLLTDGDPETVDEFGGSVSESTLLSYKDSFRRNRDLCLIVTAAFYLLNVMDAHVDAHLQDYDVSDDLSYRLRLEPTMDSYHTQIGGSVNWFGFNLSYRF